MAMMVWNFTTSHSVSKASAQLAQLTATQAGVEDTSNELTKIKSKILSLQKKSECIKKIDSRLEVAPILAELSFLVDKKIVLGKVELVAERFEDKPKNKTNSGVAGVVRVAKTISTGQKLLPLGDVRFKVLLQGLAADASEVAALICKLEDSPYFCQVVLSFSRNITVNAGANRVMEIQTAGKDVSDAGESFQASEFEISCYLANYREQL